MFAWTNETFKIIPSTTLQWHPCETHFLCARLQVPLDYTKLNGSSAAVALIKYPAQNESNTYQPSLLLNPGGPGISGVDFVIKAAPLVRQIVGPHISIIGFDPRGINNTTPSFDCFSSPVAREAFMAVWNNQLPDVNNTGDYAATYLLGKGYAEQCGIMATQDPNSMAHHIGTPNTARDMLSIVEAEAREYNTSAKDAKLWYWGQSYGTILGQTFATLFPDRVGRMILDGVSDGNTYYGNRPEENLVDADKVYGTFVEDCFKAGKDGCAFWSSSVENIRQRIQAILVTLQQQPLLYAGGDSPSGKPELLTSASLQKIIWSSMYNPLASFVGLANILSVVEAGDAGPAIRFSATSPSKSFTTPVIPTPDEAEYNIFCSDSQQHRSSNFSLADSRAYTKKIMDISSVGGQVWAQLALPCTGWNITRSSPMEREIGGNTTFPVLLLSNRLDPVTPLSSAMSVNSKFVNSLLVVINGPGHTTTATQSTCAYTHVVAYLNYGIVPKNGSVCDDVTRPFGLKEPKR